MQWRFPLHFIILMRNIYLDNNATTRVCPQVLEFVIPHLKNTYANPSSTHDLGKQTRKFIETARQQVAQYLGCNCQEVCFTSGGTESNNLAIYGAIANIPPHKNHIISTVIEHPSVIQVMKNLQQKGWKITFLPVDKHGQISLSSLKTEITENTALVSMMYANNETGVLLPIDQVSEITQKHNILFHVDAIQAIGRENIDTKKIDLLSMSAHKFHGLKGAGALYIREGTRITGHIKGGRQENNIRPGTLATHTIIAMGEICSRLKEEFLIKIPFIKDLRDNLEESILNNIPNCKVHSKKIPRLANTTNISIKGISAEILLWELSQLGIYASYGSACSSHNPEPSHVLQNMGLDWSDVTSSIRFSLSVYNTKEEIEYVKKALPKIVEKLRFMP